MLCPWCGSAIFWSGDFLCEEVIFCECGEGLISYYECTDSNCNTKIQITKDCLGGNL